jgi:hypothetical protein
MTSKNILLAILVLLLLAGLTYLAWEKLVRQPKLISCTMEAKLCDDGSSVGRTGPNCEFTACPENKLPRGYTLKSYSVEKIMETSCAKNNDCQTPDEYLIKSRCPFTSLCLQNKCTVVCPAYAGLSWDDAKSMINNCEVKSIAQQHDRTITLYFNDGQILQVTEPEIDQVIFIASDAEGKCGRIPVATE